MYVAETRAHPVKDFVNCVALVVVLLRIHGICLLGKAVDELPAATVSRCV